MSKPSGLLFERRLIEKVVAETGRCPVTDEPLSADDLVAVSTGGGGALKPRPAPATSVPGLLSLLQNEWDATVLEAHQLRGALHAARQELSHALYQHDAATRVIARLLRERDEYRGRLEAAAAAAPAAAPAPNGKRAAEEGAGGEEPAGKKARPALGADVIEALSRTSAELSKGRKKREIAPGTATPEDIAGYALTGTHPLHATRKGGILSLAVSGATVATGGADTAVTLFDRAAGQTLATLKGHSKKVLDVAFVGGAALVASASADRSVRLWRADAGGAYACAAVLDDAGGEVVAVAVHPSNDYLLTASSDGVWGFYDVGRAEALARVDQGSDSEPEAYTSAALHPDGLILCTGGAGGSVRVWETRQQKCVATFEGHVGGVASLSFSENGYYMASAAQDGVKLWDLRKLKNFKSLDSGAATAVAFDASGLFLAVGGADARVYGVKQDWEVVKTWEKLPKKGVHAVAWAPEARGLLVGAADHNLRVFS